MNLNPDILKQFKQIYGRAQKCGVEEPTAMALATVDAKNQPSVRMVLLKGYDKQGFVFFTNLESRKGTQLRTNPRAALCFHWQPLREQVLVEGKVQSVSAQEADKYWKSRPRESQLGAWASLQSRPLDRRKTLEDRLAAYTIEFRNRPVPRPASWSGFRLDPDRIEFWKARPHRLHERIVYQNTGRAWNRTLLFP